MQSVPELMDMLRQGTIHLVKMSEKLNCPWTPDEKDPRRLHNMYVRCLITCYVTKFAQMSEAILDSVDDQRFLVYAMAGRSLIEMVATLRYYLLENYKPLLNKGSLSMEEMNKLLEIHHRHMRGSRFDWDAFFSGRYEELDVAAAQALADKKAKAKTKKDPSSEGLPNQINVMTCIEKWGEETPRIMVIYALFCDLVHPNIGSSFLVASTNEDGLHFSQSKGGSFGAKIFEQSLPLLVSATMKPFGEQLATLMLTIYQDDELMTE
jgi:hypothetical protein